MIEHSISLDRRLERETARHAGSLAKLVYYRGKMPAACEFAAEGERVSSSQADETLIRRLAHGWPPAIPAEATYWRLLDNNGNVVMQGDGA